MFTSDIVVHFYIVKRRDDFIRIWLFQSDYIR